MTYRVEDTALERVFELLAEEGFDGMSQALEVLLNEMMKMERSRHLQAAPYERSEQRQGYANGFKAKRVRTRVGELGLAVPQTRDSDFYPSCLQKGLKSERALRMALAEHVDGMLANAGLLAKVDCLASLAEVAVRYQYVRPEIVDSRELLIDEGRHPVVERVLPPGEPFIPNSIRLDADREQILIITGPNMAGKSVILRQTGLIVLLAQVGSFVPAKAARIGLVDRIFTRVGASDNLAAGESTFLVEMNETANILNNASPDSLVLLDEVGRGTSTFDGLSIAWALVEYLHETDRIAARTLFATHYHELNELADRFPRVRNYRVQVQEHEGRVIFLRKLLPGGADHSYGIEVARMAGLPEPVILRAREVLRHLESIQLAGPANEADVSSGDGAPAHKPTRADAVPPLGEDSFQMSLFAAADPVLVGLREELEMLDPDRMTPVEALMKLVELKAQLRDRTA